MAYTMKQYLANRSNYGNARDTKNIKYIVIHYTSNDGDTDENNAKYYASGYRGASAHYYVDSDSITRSVPDNYVAWSVGGKKWNDTGTTGGGKFYGKCTNDNSLSIEICDDVKNGVVKPSQATINNAIEFTKAKMKEYNIPVDRVIRHFDVNGKHCPAYWCCNTANEKLWLSEFKNKLTNSTDTTTITTKTSNSEIAAQYRIKTLNRGWTQPVAAPNTAYNVNDAITAIAIGVQKGTKNYKYRVHLVTGKWLPWVTGYDINNHNNGYAGDGKTMIDLVQVQYNGNGHKVRYRIAPPSKGYYDYQYETETTNGQDGYAGVKGQAFTKFSLEIVKS